MGKQMDYHSSIEGGISRSQLRTFAKSRRLFEWLYLQGNYTESTSDALVFGSLLHCACLEPLELPNRYVVWQGRKAGNAWKAFQAEHAGSTIVTVAQAEQCQLMAEAVLRSEVGEWIGSPLAEIEQDYVTVDTVTRLKIKAKCDLVLPLEDMVVCLDIKSTVDPTPGGFRKSVLRYRYDYQVAHYREVLGGHFDKPVHFYFLAVGKDAPHLVQRYHLSDEMCEYANHQWRADMVQLGICLEMNSFHDTYENQSFEIGLGKTETNYGPFKIQK